MTNQFLVHKKTHPSQSRTTQLSAKPRPEFLSVSRNSLHVSSPTSKITCQIMSPSLAESNAKFCRKIVVASPNLLLLEAKKCAKIPCHTQKFWRDKNPERRDPEVLGRVDDGQIALDHQDHLGGRKMQLQLLQRDSKEDFQLSKVKETFCYLSLNPGWLKGILRNPYITRWCNPPRWHTCLKQRRGFSFLHHRF